MKCGLEHSSSCVTREIFSSHTVDIDILMNNDSDATAREPQARSFSCKAEEKFGDATIAKEAFDTRLGQNVPNHCKVP